MRRTLLIPAVLLGLTTAAAAQQLNVERTKPQPLSIAGMWDSKTLIGPNDSLVATTVLITTANDLGWTMTFAGREPVAVRVIARGGDSVVTEAGPYASFLRPGQTVTLIRTTAHYSGNEMRGTFTAQYGSGDTLIGKLVATRRI